MEEKLLAKRKERFLEDGDAKRYDAFLREYWERKITEMKERKGNRELIAWMESQ